MTSPLRRARCAVLAVLVLALSGCSLIPKPKPKNQPLSTTLNDEAVVQCHWTYAPGNAVDVGTPPTTVPEFGRAMMTIITNLGPITVLMDRQGTPCTVASIVYLASKHYYDGSACPRLHLDDPYYLACGDPTATGVGKPDYYSPDEPEGDFPIFKESVVMLQAGPNENLGQFGFSFKESTNKYRATYIGDIQTGQDIIAKVAKAGAADGAVNGGRPKITLTIKSVTVTDE